MFLGPSNADIAHCRAVGCPVLVLNTLEWFSMARRKVEIGGNPIAW
jgi:hypothetical protein